jgi:hypothetical protein
MDDEVPLTKFLPTGIAPETPPEPPKKIEVAATPPSWLRRKRLKLAMGLASVSAAGYGLHEFAPNLKQVDATPPTAEVAKPSVIPVAPKIAEERGHEFPKPVIDFERHDEPRPLPILSRSEEPAPLRLTAGVAPLPVPTLPVGVSAPPEITAPPVIAPPVMHPVEPAAPVIIPNIVPAPPVIVSAPVAPVEVVTPAPVEVKPIVLPPAPVPAPLPAITLPVETPPAVKPLVLPTPPIETPKPVEVVPTPAPLHKHAPLPVPEPIPAPLPVPAPATTIAAVPVVQTKPLPVVVGEPKTDYDVDLHRVKNAETYATISEKYYGNTQYAAALKAYNRGAEVNQLREVQVPPMFVIRKQTPAPTSEVVPAGTTSPSGSEPNWSGVTPPKDTGNAGDVRFETYRVPRAGMTMRDVAKAVYGNEREWVKVDNRRNIKYRPDEELPIGAELQVPVERADWR